MGKERNRNGTLKWILGLIAVGGFLITLAGVVWNASTINSMVRANCAEDAKIHPVAERNEKTIIGMEKDIDEIQRTQKALVTGQESISKKLDDLYMLQLVGPGSNPERPPR